MQLTQSQSTTNTFQGHVLVPGTTTSSSSSTTAPLLVSDVGLSFWGGIDPSSSQIVDTQHPLHGQYVQDTILCIPTGRGSCTASQVLLQLILDHKAPRAIVLRQNDPLLAVGALVAQHVLQDDSLQIPTILYIGTEAYAQLVSLLSSNKRLEGRIDATKAQLLVSSDWNHSLLQHSDHDNASKSHSIDIPWTAYEQERWDQATTQAERLALKVMFQYARIAMMEDSSASTFQTPSYVSVSRAHIDACTYIGSGSLELVQRFVQAGGQVQIPTTLNSVSTDRRQWQQLGVPSPYAHNANALGDAYLQLNCQPTFTCAPYLLLSDPPFHTQDWVWGESNAVVYANSVLGARTNKTADYLDLCGALTGIVPRTGMHCPEQRVPTILLDATELVPSVATQWESSLFFALLGHACGTLSNGAVPLLVGLEEMAHSITPDDLKTFCAAFGTTGSSPLIHIAGITAEATDMEQVEQWKQYILNAGTVKVTTEFLEQTYIALNSSDTSDHKVDLIALGNPHLSVSECQTLVDLIGNTTGVEQKHPHVRIMACISRAVQAIAEEQGLIEPLQDFGIEFINDTCWCMLLDPPVIPAAPDATILTNSGKYAHYGPGLTQRQFKIGSTADCISAARTGVFRPTIRSFQTRAHGPLRRGKVIRSIFQFLSRTVP